MIIYEDLYTFREIYCNYSKEALERHNEIVLIASTYEDLGTMRDMLTDYGVDVQYHESNGSLLIMDSAQGFQTGDTYGVLRLVQSLAIRAEKHGKKGIVGISDMGSFFLFNREKELVTYELSIPKRIDIRIKAFCCYHKNDFGLRLTMDQQESLTNHHQRVMSSSTFR
jgi:MEDS: MEthanogen/methylotroph, DcmR Sensory domain